MNMFANLRIGTRLGLGFGVLLALILAVAGLSQYAQQSVGEVTDQITQRDFIKTEILYGIMLTNQEAVAQTNKMLQLTEVGEVKRIVDGWSSAPTNDKYKQLTELTKSPAGKAMLADLIEVRKVYSPIRAKTIGLLVEGKREEAAKFWNNEGLPALAAYRTQLQKMLKYQKEQVESGTKKIADSNRSSSVLIFSASAFALLLGAVIAVLITRSITRPLREAVEMADKVAAGKPTSAVKKTRQDEQGPYGGA